MEEQGTVVLVRPSIGGVAIRVQDGSYVLAEQMGREPLGLGQLLSGQMNSIGTADLCDVHSGAAFAVFVQAFGCSYEAVRDALT